MPPSSETSYTPIPGFEAEGVQDQVGVSDAVAELSTPVNVTASGALVSNVTGWLAALEKFPNASKHHHKSIGMKKTLLTIAVSLFVLFVMQSCQIGRASCRERVLVAV